MGKIRNIIYRILSNFTYSSAILLSICTNTTPLYTEPEEIRIIKNDLHTIQESLHSSNQKEILFVKEHIAPICDRTPYSIWFTISNNTELYELFSMDTSQSHYEKAITDNKDILINFTVCNWGDCSCGINKTISLIEKS